MAESVEQQNPNFTYGPNGEKTFKAPAKGTRKAGALKKIDLKYPLDTIDYKGRLVFQLVEEPEDNKLVQDSTRQARVKQYEEGLEIIDATNQRIRDQIEAAEAGDIKLREGVSTEDFRDLGEGLIERGEGVKKEAQERIDFLEGDGYDEQKGKLGPNFDGEIHEPPVIKNTKVSIYLPMALNFRDNVSYENTDLGTVGGLVEGAARGGADAGGLKGMIKSITEGATNTFKDVTSGNSPELAKLAALQLNVISKLPGAEGLKGAAKQAAQVTLNPNTRSLFKSVAIREFAFQFKFIAKSKQEADEVRKIVKFFRTELYPEALTVGEGDTTVAVGYRFPRKFVLTPMYNNQPIKETKILPCYLRDISVVYNPTNQSMHGGDDPHFTEVDMSLSFTETRTLSRQEVDMEGGY
tara:strand:+ start:43 stop:1269 length:1227 start_codon:yes stop_codon:yes gene_type:complete